MAEEEVTTEVVRQTAKEAFESISPESLEAVNREKRSMVIRNGLNTLNNFTISYLKSLKLVNNNFKTGLDLVDGYSATLSPKEHGRLFKIIKNELVRQIPSLKNEDVYTYTFLETKHDSLDIRIVIDPINVKIVNKINAFFEANNLHLKVAPSRSISYYAGENYNLTIRGTGASTNASNNLSLVENNIHSYSLISYSRNIDANVDPYRTLFYLPRIISFLKLLHRRAHFRNAELRKFNRSSRVDKILSR